VIKLRIAALNMGQTVISFSDCGVYARTEVESVLIAVATRTAIATSSPNQLPPATTWSSSTVCGGDDRAASCPAELPGEGLVGSLPV
jgi:hypothetical protein